MFLEANGKESAIVDDRLARINSDDDVDFQNFRTARGTCDKPFGKYLLLELNLTKLDHVRASADGRPLWLLGMLSYI